jgi:type II secretory pathway component PulF
MRSLEDVMRKLDHTGQRLTNIERAVAAAKERLRAWRLAALVGIGAAILLFFAWQRERWQREHCERHKQL